MRDTRCIHVHLLSFSCIEPWYMSYDLPKQEWERGILHKSHCIKGGANSEMKKVVWRKKSGLFTRNTE